MHQLALGSLQADTGLGGVISVVCAAVFILCRVGMMYGMARRGSRARRLPDGGFGYGAGPAQRGEPGSPTAPHGETTEGPVRRQQHDSYWEPQEQDGTLPADGFIGDPGETGPAARRE